MPMINEATNLPAEDRGPGPSAPAPRGTPEGRPSRPSVIDVPDPALSVRELSMWYGQSQALHRVSLNISKKKITAFIGQIGRAHV